MRAVLVACGFILVLGVVAPAQSVADAPRVPVAVPLEQAAEGWDPAPDALDVEKRRLDDGEALWFGNGVRLAVAPGIDPALPSPLRGILVVQLPAAPRVEDRAALVATGVRIDDVIQGHAYLVEAAPASDAALRALLGQGRIRAIVPYPAEAKIEAQLFRAAAATSARLRVAVELHHPPTAEDDAAIRSSLQVDRATTSPTTLLRGYVDGSRLPALAALPQVKWIETWAQAATNNLEATMATGADRVFSYGQYDGTGVRVAIDDTGITRTGSATECGASGAAYHTDLPSSRILDQWDFYNADANACDDDGHGTHVAGTVGGNGAYIDEYTGVAPGCSYLIYKDAGPPGSPNQFSNFSSVLSRAASMDANVVGNSWGAASLAYDANARHADRAVNGFWNGSDGSPQYMALTISSGNAGGITGTPALSKNAIAVGATKDGNDVAGPWCFCAFWSPTACGVNCVTYTNSCVDEYRPPSQKICFSNGGPVDTDGDGNTRVKPDVVVPGTTITSTAASHLQPGGVAKYETRNGTSMAQPQVAGTLALMMDAQPGLADWPEMHKARLLATATSLGSTSSFGHGMVDAFHCVYDSSSLDTVLWTGNYIDGTGNFVDHTFTVPAGFDQVRVYVAYTDAVSTTTETVNDLDLRVYDGAGALVASSLSREDTVEDVRTASGQSGTWRARVTGYSVPQPWTKYGICAIVMNTQPSLSLAYTVSDSCIRPNQPFTVDATLSNPGSTAAASEMSVDLPSSSTMVLDDATVTSNATGRSKLYLDDDLFHDTTNNVWYLSTGQVNQYVTHSGSFTLRAAQGASDGTYTVYLRAQAYGEASTGPNISIEIDGTPPGTASSLRSTDHTVGVCSNDMTMTMAWTAAPDGAGCGIAGYAHSWSGTPELPWPFQTLGNVTTFTDTRTPTVSGVYFNLRALDNAGNWSPSYVSVGPYYLDDTLPGVATNLASPTHAVGSCSGNGGFTINWTAAPDTYCGIRGYGYSFTSTPTLPAAIRFLDAVTTFSTTLGPADFPRYFNLRAVDDAGNWSTGYVSYGPFTVDAIPPTVLGLTQAKQGADIALQWTAAPNANYYRVYRTTDPTFATRTLVGTPVTGTSTTHVGGVNTPEPLVFYKVLGTNVCGAEGPL